MSVPLDGSAPMMLYRTDLFAAAGLSRPPATWAEVLTAAAALNGTDMDGDGEEDFALCFRPDPGEARDRKGPIPPLALRRFIAVLILPEPPTANPTQLSIPCPQPKPAVFLAAP